MNNRPNADVRRVQASLLYEHAADELRRQIYAGTYRAGDRINEAQLASDLGLSRGPVREALRLLQQEGLIVATAQRGFSLAQPTERDISDALNMRAFLECLHCDRTVRLITDIDIESLAARVENMRQLEKTGTQQDLAAADFGFHEQLLQVASSATVARTWQALASQIRFYLSLGNAVWTREKSVAESHRPILDALRERDAAKLERVLSKHVEENRASLRCSLTNSNE